MKLAMPLVESDPNMTYMNVGHESYNLYNETDEKVDYEEEVWFIDKLWRFQSNQISGDQVHNNYWENHFNTGIAKGRYDPNTGQCSLVPLNIFDNLTPLQKRSFTKKIVDVLHKNYGSDIQIMPFGSRTSMLFM